MSERVSMCVCVSAEKEMEMVTKHRTKAELPLRHCLEVSVCVIVCVLECAFARVFMCAYA